MEHLKKLRESKGLLQKDVAEFLGVDRTTYVKYEKGKNDPDSRTLLKLAKFFGVSVDELLGADTPARKGVKIPVYGSVAAGIPIEAITDIEDYEEIPEDWTTLGEYAALRIHGDSMEPRMFEGDVVIVRIQSDVDSGDTAIIFVEKENATCKKIKKTPEGIMLIPSNPSHEPIFYTNTQITDLPVTIFGKVVELRAKY